MRLMILAALLLAGAPALAQSNDQPAPRQSDPERLICKRFAETGSLVKKRKVCYTARQWTTLNDNERDSATTWVEGMRSKPSGE